MTESIKCIKVSNQTHSQLFSLKCKYKKKNYDQVLQILIDKHFKFTIPLLDKIDDIEEMGYQ